MIRNQFKLRHLWPGLASLAGFVTWALSIYNDEDAQYRWVMGVAFLGVVASMGGILVIVVILRIILGKRLDPDYYSQGRQQTAEGTHAQSP